MGDMRSGGTVAVPDESADILRRLVDGFVEAKRQKSEHTEDAYRRDLASWLGWCAANQVDPLKAWTAHVQFWLTALADQGEAGTTRARRLGAVSSWYRWLVRHQFAAANPAHLESSERPPRTPRRAPALSDDQVAALFAAADADSVRAAAIVHLLLYTGIRVGEMIAANVADVGLDRGHPVLHVLGKGGKRRVVPLVPPVLDRLDAYLSARPDPTGELVPVGHAGAGTSRPLIATASGKRIDRKAVRLLLRRLARKADLPEALVSRLSPHAARATYATASLDDGVPVRDVQYALGHASPVTTEGYDRSQLSPERSPSYRLMRRFGGR